jgi:hypothetical protein
MRGISGLIIILVIVGALCFSGAGGKLWDNVRGLDGSCYAAIERMGTSMGGPICDAVGRGIASLETVVSGIGDKINLWKEQTFGSTSSGT